MVQEFFTISRAEKLNKEKQNKLENLTIFPAVLSKGVHLVPKPLSTNLYASLLSRGVSMETLGPHEYDIPVVRGGHLEGTHVFGFLIHTFPSEIWSQT